MDLSKYAGNSGEQHPFIKPTDVSPKGTSVKVLDCREAGRGMKFSDILLDLSIGNKKFTWGLRLDSVTTSQLIGELGPNTDKWKGKTIKLIRAMYVPKRGKNRGKKTPIINVA